MHDDDLRVPFAVGDRSDCLPRRSVPRRTWSRNILTIRLISTCLLSVLRYISHSLKDEMKTSIYAAATAGLVASTIAQNATSSSLPIVDLGYELHQASSLNSSAYWFDNIRYAAPPTGNNRFRAPQAPVANRTVVQTGSPDRICPQAAPTWGAIVAEFLTDYLAGQTVFDASSFNTSSSSSAAPVQDPRTTEDCLFLDVVVPENIFNSAGQGYGAPVLVWIYGGGYTEGSKSGSGNPAGLLARSQSNNATGVIVSCGDCCCRDLADFVVVRGHELPPRCFRLALRPNVPSRRSSQCRFV